jgi:hypothetical protein
MSDGGKGSAPRPLSVSNEEYSKRWDAIFQRDIKAEDEDKSWNDEEQRLNREQALKILYRENEQ